MRYFIGLGSNQGDRLVLLRSATSRIASASTIGARSRVYESSPVGGPPQPDFLNAAIAIDCALAPHDLLALCKSIERAHGRSDASPRFGPRPLDLDILLGGDRGELRLSTPELVIPHPRLHQRAFALAPLIDLDESLRHPLLAQPLQSILQSTARDPAQQLRDTHDRL